MLKLIFRFVNLGSLGFFFDGFFSVPRQVDDAFNRTFRQVACCVEPFLRAKTREKGVSEGKGKGGERGMR